MPASCVTEILRECFAAYESGRRVLRPIRLIGWKECRWSAVDAVDPARRPDARGGALVLEGAARSARRASARRRALLVEPLHLVPGRSRASVRRARRG